MFLLWLAVTRGVESLPLFRSDSSLDPLVQALEVLITSELNMNQAAPGACGTSSLFSMAVSDTMLFFLKKKS